MNIEMLRREFAQILSTEERAKAFYDHYSDQVDDPRIKKILIQIRDDEAMHIAIARKLLEYVK